MARHAGGRPCSGPLQPVRCRTKRTDAVPVRIVVTLGRSARGIMTIRVLGPHERGRFAPEAWGHLLALSGAGALNPAELEQVIERAMLQLSLIHISEPTRLL